MLISEVFSTYLTDILNKSNAYFFLLVCIQLCFIKYTLQDFNKGFFSIVSLSLRGPTHKKSLTRPCYCSLTVGTAFPLLF